MYTPPEAILYIEPYLPREVIYWEACYGKGHMADELRKLGLSVVGDENMNCLAEQPPNWDIFITNPPFNGNKLFFNRAIDLGKPFAILCRLEHLGGVEALRLFKDINIQVIIPEKRINYITPKMIAGLKTSGSPFHSVWVTHGMSLPRDILYEKLSPR